MKVSFEPKFFEKRKADKKSVERWRSDNFGERSGRVFGFYKRYHFKNREVFEIPAFIFLKNHLNRCRHPSK
jgi:hypothetical protein